MILIIIYLLFCLLVAWGYSDTVWGFGGGFVFSLLLTPLLGLIVMFFIPTKPDESMNQQLLLNQQQLLQQQMNASQPKTSLTDELLKLEHLKEKKLITEVEYQKLRDKVMSQHI